MTPTPAPATLPGHCKHECVCSPYRMIVGHTYGTDDYACVKQNCEHDTRRSRPAPSPQLPENIRVECQSHTCERCIPIGKRNKRNSIRDGRFDTKEDCCKTRFGETGCPRSIEIKQARALAEHDAAIRQQERERVLKELDLWRIKRMNGMLKKDVWIGWNDETDFIKSLRSTTKQEVQR